MRKGFTLIELLIVITIIGILAVVVVPTTLKAPAKARDTRRISDISNIMKAVEAGRLDGVSFPVASTSPTWRACVNDTTFSKFLKYFNNNTVPKDPNNLKLASCAIGEYLFINWTTFPSNNGHSSSMHGFRYAILAPVEIPDSNGNTKYCNGTDPNSYLRLYSSDAIASPSSDTVCYSIRQT